ncbi:MAG: hypothetical protein LBH37_00695 [Oscillospiraceae bacterium]|nr:hypothetical protein [Oscillospiraceae bacterium]
MHKGIKLRRICVILLGVFVIASIIASILFYLITVDDNFEKFSDDVSADSLGRIITASISNQEVSMKNRELNSLLNFIVRSKIKSENSSNQQENTSLEGVNILLEEDAKNKTEEVELYLSTVHRNVRIGITAKVKIFLSDQKTVCLEVNRVKFGRLRVPKFVFFWLLGKKIPKDWEIKENKICVPSTSKVNVGGHEVILRIEQFLVCGPEVKLKIKIEEGSIKEFSEKSRLKNFIGNNIKDIYFKARSLLKSTNFENKIG